MSVGWAVLCGFESGLWLFCAIGISLVAPQAGRGRRTDACPDAGAAGEEPPELVRGLLS